MHRLLSLSCMKPNLLDALRQNGINTVADFISCDVDRLARTILVPSEDLSSLQKTVIAQASAFTMNGSDFYEDMMSRFCILSSGCDNLDELLDGGLYTGELTEIVGAAGVGKSQICMSIAMFTATETKNNVLYIDTGGSLSATRIKEMLQGWNSSLDDQEVHDILSRISVIQAFDIFSVLEALESVRQRICNQGDDGDDDSTQHLRIIIVDSVAGVISPILGGQQIHGHSLMVNLSRILKSLAVEHSVAVVITNNVVTDSSKSSFSTKPALGPTWAHVPNTRLFIQKNPASQANSSEVERIATLTKSSRQKLQVSSAFYIDHGGLYSRRPVSQNLTQT
ncbi:DNA repair protein rad51d [Desmophyllum pertusum]|uniref:DNA repair protein rad51d n=1 Tax=Desmophyllum pertusum TaxID=174260 RepID=A0A9W9ZTB3_9CNID|nr:DNA repair protein rad51d [Desmophyllum pertusum]